jgi:hypothetical protein
MDIDIIVERVQVISLLIFLLIGSVSHRKLFSRRKAKKSVKKIMEITAPITSRSLSSIRYIL